MTNISDVHHSQLMEEQQFTQRYREQRPEEIIETGIAHDAGHVAFGAEAAIDEVLQSEEQKMIDKLLITRLVGGLNFGEGTISKDDRLKSSDDALNNTLVNKVEQAIQTPEIITPVEADDDGCGDGRFVKIIKQGTETFKRTLNRAKVFGGGLTMAVAARIGLSETNGEQLEVVFTDSMSLLDKKQIPYGAHTDDHAHGDNCGCGAIDKAPAIIANANKFKEQIEGAISLLTGKKDNQALHEVFDHYNSYAATIAGQPYKGSKVMNKIFGRNKVVKELGGPHLETHIVINTVRDMTVNQEYIRQISDGKAQVFGVDAWRMQDIAARLYPDNKEKQEKAYVSMLVYTLATAGTLTKGDLPVYVVQQ